MVVFQPLKTMNSCVTSMYNENPDKLRSAPPSLCSSPLRCETPPPSASLGKDSPSSVKGLYVIDRTGTDSNKKVSGKRIAKRHVSCESRISQTSDKVSTPPATPSAVVDLTEEGEKDSSTEKIQKRKVSTL